MPRNPLPLTALLFLPLTPQGSAQTVVLDGGTFVVSIEGRQAGTESFTIRRSGSGDEARVIAQATVDLDLPSGRRTLAPALEATGRDMTIQAYQIKVTGDQEEEVSLFLNGRRFVASVRSREGEQVREYRASPGVLILEDRVAHQYYFLGPLLDAGAPNAPVIVPRTGAQVQMRITSVGNESIQVGGRAVEARHIRLEAGDQRREVWLDAQGRVLRVENPGAGYQAVRREPPG